MPSKCSRLSCVGGVRGGLYDNCNLSQKHVVIAISVPSMFAGRFLTLVRRFLVGV